MRGEFQVFVAVVLALGSVAIRFKQVRRVDDFFVRNVESLNCG